MLKPGCKGRCEKRVTEDMTALAMGSGALEVLATPAVAAMMEQAAWESIQPHLEPGQATVGTLLTLHHQSATPPGLLAWVESELLEVDGRRLVFRLNAFDEQGPIAQGEHERFIVDSARFLEKSKRKLGQKAESN
ncbi:MAG: thioesterase family protein [Candidatus Pelethousia sp.]|nr:thioesterase family protein [Candidatus Pelethousia sp.]